jgi:hypothetical protein
MRRIQVAIFKNDVVMALDKDGNLNYMGYAYLATKTFSISYGELGRIIQNRKSYKAADREEPVWFSVVTRAQPEPEVQAVGAPQPQLA